MPGGPYSITPFSAKEGRDRGRGSTCSGVGGGDDDDDDDDGGGGGVVVGVGFCVSVRACSSRDVAFSRGHNSVSANAHCMQ